MLTKSRIALAAIALLGTVSASAAAYQPSDTEFYRYTLAEQSQDAARMAHAQMTPARVTGLRTDKMAESTWFLRAEGRFFATQPIW